LILGTTINTISLWVTTQCGLRQEFLCGSTCCFSTNHSGIADQHATSATRTAVLHDPAFVDLAACTTAQTKAESWQLIIK
jgi:hypothetical protein